MRYVLPWLLLSLAALGQSAPTRIAPDEAAKHLIKKSPAIYPSLAETARIQGNVIIEISIDDSGSVSSRRLISGHPLLVPAALDAVSKWKYQPFEVNGRPATVVTVTMVTFGNPSNHDAEDRAEMLLQHNFWSAVDSAGLALGRNNFADAEEQLNKADALLPQASADRRHVPERWQWLMHMGRVRTGQQKYSDAEQYYQKALALRQKDNRDAPEVAATLASLGVLYTEEKQYVSARDYSNRSIAIYRKNFNRAGSGNPGAQQVYGRAVAYQSSMLSKLASQKNDPAEVSRYCRTFLEFQNFLASEDRESLASTCQGVSTVTPNH